MVHIPIHIPIGVKYVAKVNASSLKLVSCENCKESCAFLFDVAAEGSDLDLLFFDSVGSKERANAQARDNLASKIRNVVIAIPCPQCGFYQAEMARQLKEDAWSNPMQVIGATVVLISLIPLAFDIAYAWVWTVVVAITGVVLLAYGYIISFRYDPNEGDSGPRKAIGQKNSVWGDQLAKLLPQIAASVAREESDDAGKA